MHKRSVLAALDDPATGNLTKHRARREKHKLRASEYDALNCD
jgi:hypothetical protein